MLPGEETYKKVRAAFLMTSFKSFSAYCQQQGKTHIWGRACILHGESIGPAARDFFNKTLEDCGLLKESKIDSAD